MSQCFNLPVHPVLQSCFCCSGKKIDIIPKHTKTTIWGGGGGMGMLLSVTYWPACVTMTTLFFPVSGQDFASIHKKFQLKKDLYNGFSFSFFFFSLLLISWNKILFYISTRYVFIYIVITRLKHVMETWRYGIHVSVFKSTVKFWK